MRVDNTLFTTDNADTSKRPRYVVSIDFDGTVQYFTSHGDIANVPGTPIDNVIQGISATSQTLNPDRANATIGSMSFDIVDLAEAFTDLVRTELDTNDVGLRGRTVQFFMGYKSEQDGAGILDGSSTDDNPDFNNFILFQTQIIQSVETKESRYSIKCADIQRDTKRQIFELALTYLTNTISDTATTIPVLDLSGFEGNFHGTSYTDAPSANVIYIRIDSTKEIIRCPVSGISGNDFTGVTRGVLGTTAKPVEVDQTQASDRRPKVEEYVYLELPAVKAAYAILTGDIEGTANVLPSGWHAGVDPSFVRLTDFQNIGEDLWDTTDDTLGIVLRFDGIEKQDAKKFLETEIYLLLGLFSPVYADGQLGLKRMVPSLSDSPYSFLVDDSNSIGSGVLRHDMQSMQNNIRIDWNWNGDRFIRSTIIVDANSITRHGQALEKRLGFRGLVGTRFTEQVLRQLLTSLRDMYAGPPLRLDVSGFHLMNPVEVGDAGRVDLSNIRDYSQAGTNLQRTMVVHGMSVDWLKGVKLKLFGSSERADEIPPITATTCLPDAFYPSVGTALNTVPGLMTGDVTNAGTFTLIGSTDMNAAASIFYHDAALTISSTTTLNIEGNVQIRVKGFITINGTIDGTGEGLAPGASLFDSGQHYYWAADVNVGTPGFIGNSQSHRGLLFRYPDDGGAPDWVWSTAGYFTEGLHQAFPNVVLVVDDAGSGSITGIPTDMRGGGGAHGQRAGEKTGLGGRTFQRVDGGAGGQGGAALCIVCRGGDFGISGQITLDGGDGVEPATFFADPDGDYDIYGGAGGAGTPGALLWLLDGSAQTFPDLAGHFSALTGDVPAQYALPLVQGQGNQSLTDNNRPRKNMAPFFPGERISGFDQTGVNFRILYLPCDVIPEDDQDAILAPPTGFAAATVPQGVRLTWTLSPQPDEHPNVLTEIWRANENVRASAVVIAAVGGEVWIDTSSDIEGERFYWSRVVDEGEHFSVYEPDTSTTTARAFPLIGSPIMVSDPFIRLSTAPTGDPHWETTSATQGEYILGHGVDGTDVIRMGVDSSQRIIWANPRHGPDVFDYQVPSRAAIKVRWRAALHDAGGGTWTQILRGFIRVTDISDANVTTYNEPGSHVWSQADTLDEWHEDSTIIIVDESAETPPRFVKIGIRIQPNSLGPEWDIDLIDAELVGEVFAGAEKSGIVLAPATETGLFLKDDGTFGTPTGSGVDSFNTRIGAVSPIQADYDSFFLTPAEGDAAYSLLGHSHAAADVVSGTFLDARIAASNVTQHEGAINHDNLLGFVAQEHIRWDLTGAENVHADRFANDSIGLAKLVDTSATNRFIGRITAGAGNYEELTAANARTIINVEDGSTADQTAGEIEAIVNHDNLLGFVAQEHIRWDLTGAENVHADRYTDTVYAHPNHSGDVTSVGDGAQTIVPDAVTYAKMQNVAADDRILGNVAGAGGIVAELTAAQVRTMINVVDSFNSRTGAVSPVQADYDSFFLTPAEGDAAYSLLGHSHIAADITDFDTEVSNNAAVSANTSKVSNATHTGDATGATALTLAAAAITGKPALTSGLAGTDELLLSDAGVLKRMDISVMNSYFDANLNFSAVDHLHDGIADTNLVSKIAAETISAAWTITSNEWALQHVQPKLGFEETGLGADLGNWLVRLQGGDWGVYTATDAAPATIVTPGIIFRRGATTAVSSVDVQTAFRVFDIGNTDSLAMSHTGTNFTFVAVNTTDIQWTGAAVHKFDGTVGARVQVYYLRTNLSTQTELRDIADTINTHAGKVKGAQVFDETNNKPVWAASDADGGDWLNADGTTAHTPV